MGWILDTCVDQSRSGGSAGYIKVTNLVFVDDAVLLVEQLEILLIGFEELDEKANPLGFKII